MDPLDPAARFLVPKLVSLASPPQLGGQFGVVAPQTQVHRSRFEQVPGPQEDLGLIERLGHEIHGAGGQRPISGLLCRVRGEDDYREVLVGGNHARERLEDGETIQMGHVEVQQHQIGHDLLLPLHVASDHLVLAREHFGAAQMIQRPPLGRRHQPRAGFFRNAGRGPML